MKYCEFNGKQMSKLVFGTGTDKVTGEDQGLAFDVLDMAYEKGFNTFDTAHTYGNAERNLGDWADRRGLRDKILILDKGCNPGQKGITDIFGERCIREQLEESFHRLKTDYVDMYILHRDDENKPVDEIVEVLNEFKSEGHIGAFGGSNWSVDRIREANEYAREHNLTGFTVASPAFNIAEKIEDPWGASYHISGSKRQQERAFYVENSIPVFAYSALGRGFFSGKYKTSYGSEIEKYLSWAPIQEYYCPENVEKLKLAEELSEQKQVTVSAIVLAWLMQQKVTVYPIISPTSEKHMDENLKAFDITLTEAESNILGK